MNVARAIALLGAAAATGTAVHATMQADPAPDMRAAGCRALATATSVLPTGARVTKAAHVEAGPGPAPAFAPAGTPGPALPAHCEIFGVTHERTGADGQRYAIRFHLRLPDAWNGRFLFEGGGGTNGEVGNAVGQVGMGQTLALARSFAVVTQDSGHDNAVNTDPARGGTAAFGYDAQARADYGGASLPVVTAAAKALVAAFYGRAPERSYFYGCSKGGQEGMAAAQRYPDLFDGIVANAPGFSLPRAAIAEAWDTQSFARVVAAQGRPLTLDALAASFSNGDLEVVRGAILAACDADDGVKDGITGALAACTSAKVVPALRARTCTGGKAEGCLSGAQVDALRRTHDGPVNRAGKPLYASFPWDAGWGGFGWRMWKIGSADGGMKAANVMLAMPALGAIFTTPPKAPAPGPDGALAYAVAFDFDRDAPRIYATAPGFPRSAWSDIAARSPDIDRFRARGGRMIVVHGASDPVFSLADSQAWWREVDQRSRGRAADTVRVFAVPGMAHCGLGPATDDIDALASLTTWVEQGRAPDRIVARAGPGSPWPGRTRPLCPFPREPRYRGSGDIEAADSFTCAAPARRRSA